MPLIVVPTPIGNLEDMTLRGLREMREADCIACEDTRHTLKLLNHFEIKKPLISCHEHNEKDRIRDFLLRLKQGQRVVLVSDAGTPGISDPGYLLISAAIAEGFPVDVLPGANALLPALLLSGLRPSPFLFVGFLEGKRGEKIKQAKAHEALRAALVFYLSPHRLSEDLGILFEVLGNRRAALVREISKMHQEVLRGTLESLNAQVLERTLRGEFVLVVEGNQIEEVVSDDAWQEEALSMQRDGIYAKEIVNSIGERYGILRNKIKKFLLEEKREGEE